MEAAAPKNLFFSPKIPPQLVLYSGAFLWCTALQCIAVIIHYHTINIHDVSNHKTREVLQSWEGMSGNFTMPCGGHLVLQFT